MKDKCNKMSFETAKDAREQISKGNRAKNRGAYSNKKYRPYLCPCCDKWHLTTQTKIEARRSAKEYDKKNAERGEVKRMARKWGFL